MGGTGNEIWEPGCEQKGQLNGMDSWNGIHGMEWNLEGRQIERNDEIPIRAGQRGGAQPKIEPRGGCTYMWEGWNLDGYSNLTYLGGGTVGGTSYNLVKLWWPLGNLVGTKLKL
ncbi:hypothetical protein M758_8G006800 [Ceratodon purpureus]|uniref:Uncharacterized protein n=1 Tax=Ceratodon purpureus TaxID=3225 RepID=A0A8T0GYF3_CERPU|nr:hypothetical protein KC19_8G007500 [Ceratodon purpureus]KAG0607168.1 hypothetical protein M758_8G006800 [Ceratodon purpureus]